MKKNKTLLIVDLQEDFIKYKPYNSNGIITNHDALYIYNYINEKSDFFTLYNNVIQIVDNTNFDF
jgi:hypothetical protein